MFYARLMLQNIRRHSCKSILHILIGIVTLLLLNSYAGNLVSTRSELLHLPEAVEIYARISNLAGSQSEGIQIKEETMCGIRASEHVRDEAFTVRLKMGFGRFTREEYEGRLNYYGVGTNCIAGVPGMKPEEVEFLEGRDESFLETSEKGCLIDKDIMEKEGLEPGDEIELTVFYYRYEGHEMFIDPLYTDTYRIVGVTDIKESLSGWILPDIILPLETVREMYHIQGIPFFADSGAFYVKDPFRLNECKEEMHGIGLLSVITAAEFQYDGNALTMMDETFIRTAQTLEESCALLEGMLPFVVIIIMCIGYTCSYLLMQGRREEYAIMRSLGMGRMRCFFVLLGESFLIEAAACITGSAAALWLLHTEREAAVLSGIIFSGSFLAGTAAALLSLHFLSVMEVLTRND